MCKTPIYLQSSEATAKPFSGTLSPAPRSLSQLFKSSLIRKQNISRMKQREFNKILIHMLKAKPSPTSKPDGPLCQHSTSAHATPSTCSSSTTLHKMNQPENLTELMTDGETRDSKDHAPSADEEMSAESGNARERCDICGKTFLKSAILQHKYQAHPRENKVACDVCGDKVFKFQLQAHKVQAHKVKPICKVCGKELHPGSVKRHMLNQHPEIEVRASTKVNCQLCGMAVLPQNLAQHNQYLHADQPNLEQLPVGCDTCHEVIPAAQLAAHKAEKHEKVLAAKRGKKKISCKICRRTFLPCSLKKHMLWMHSGDEQLKKMKISCPCCDASLKPCNLKSHVKSFHVEQFPVLFPEDESCTIQTKVEAAEQEAKKAYMQQQRPLHYPKLSITLF